MGSSAFDVIVVGLGAIGSATCRVCAERGVRVLGIEQFDIPHRFSSYHGDSRAFRLAYFEHPDYVPLLRSAQQMWYAWQEQWPQHILHETGALYIGPPECELVHSSITSARQHSIPCDVLEADEVRQQFTQFKVADGAVGVYEPEAITLRPERIVSMCIDIARRTGATVHGNERVQSWEQNGDVVHVQTDAGSYQCGNLILCAGPWLGSLCRDLGVQLQPSRQCIGWFQPPFDARTLRHDQMPFWGNVDAAGRFVYGFPLLDDRPGLKIGVHMPGESVNPDSIDRVVSKAELHELAVALCSALEMGSVQSDELKVWTTAVCMYTNTADAHFVVDRHPQADRVVMAGGMSGHGFKFAPVLADVLADLAINGTTSHPIGFLSLSRPGLAASPPAGAADGSGQDA